MYVSVLGTMGRGARESLTCNKAGRYLIIELLNSGILTLCEVKVQGYGKLNMAYPILFTH